MTPVDFLIKELKNFHEKYSYIEINYEYRKSINTHIIEIKPEKYFKEDKDVIDHQIQLEDEFELNYPSESILFITDNELISVENPILELGISFIDCDYEIIHPPIKVGFTFEDIEKSFSYFSIEGSYEIPIPPPKKKWYQNLIKAKDLESNQGLFFYIFASWKNQKKHHLALKDLVFLILAIASLQMIMKG